MSERVEINANVNKWLIELAGDGAHDSFIVEGDLHQVQWALENNHAEEYAKDLFESENWDMYGIFCLDLEQVYICITPIRRILK
jgi:hypothetical protein